MRMCAWSSDVCSADLLAAAPDCNLADVAWTLASGRKAFAHRLALVAGDAADAATQLRGDELASTAARSRPARDSDVVFMFPGQGAVYPGMGRGLYASEPVFRQAIEDCVAALSDTSAFHSTTGTGLRQALSRHEAPPRR